MTMSSIAEYNTTPTTGTKIGDSITGAAYDTESFTIPAGTVTWKVNTHTVHSAVITARTSQHGITMFYDNNSVQTIDLDTDYYIKWTPSGGFANGGFFGTSNNTSTAEWDDFGTGLGWRIANGKVTGCLDGSTVLTDPDYTLSGGEVMSIIWATEPPPSTTTTFYPPPIASIDI